MAVSNGSTANAATFNAAFVSKSVDSTVTSKVTLNRAGSGSSVTDLQQEVNDILADIVTAQADILARIPSTEKGAASGVCPLDVTGKVSTTYLPSSVLGAIIYQGTWNASTNTPTLTDAGGSQGQYFVVSVAGTQDLGSGSVAYDINDWIVHNGLIWEKLDAENVQSVNGATGVVSVPIFKPEFRTITVGEAAAKSLTLAYTPVTPSEVCLDVVGGAVQFYGDDYSVSGTTLSWNALGLDGVLDSGDKIRIMYSYNP